MSHPVKIPFGHRKVEIVQGDITKEKTRAIVCPHNPSFAMMAVPGGVQHAIYARVGENCFREAEAESERQWKVTGKPVKEIYFPVGHAIKTTSGDLPAGNIIHVVSADFKAGEAGRRYADEHVIREAVKGALNKAKEHGLKSISIPAIGTGYGATIEETVYGALKAVREHFQHDTTVEHVRLVYYSPQDFEEAKKAYYARAIFGDKTK